MGNSHSRQQPPDRRRSPWRLSTRPRRATRPAVNSENNEARGIRANNAHQQDLLQTPWPRETRPSLLPEDTPPSRPDLDDVPEQTCSSMRRRSVLNRARDSVTPTFFRRNRSSMLFDLPDRDTPPWALGNPPEPGNPFQLPSVESGPDLSVPHLASPTVDNQQRHSRPRPPSYPIMPTIADRLSSYTPAREISRLTAAIRRGRSQLNGGREQHADNFSHLLTIAAQATAASLTGNNPQAAVEELRRAAMALDPDDGSFDGFMEYLLSGRLSTQLARNIAINAEGRPQRLIDHTPAPLDFFRIFQLRGLSINNEPRQTARESLRRSLRPRRTPSISRNRASSLAALEEHSTGERQAVPDGVEGRVVPVLIVGIRALGNAGDGAQPRLEGEERLPSFLDALTNLGPGIQAPTNDDILGEGLQSYRNSERLRRRQRRRASMGAFFSADRPQRPRPTDVGRPRSEVGPSTASSTPSGPSPPPTTPASAPLSALSSGATTPNRPLAITNPDQSAHENESSSSRIPRTSTLNPTVEEPRPEEEIANLRRTQRRRSESDSMRYGSGSARRNGVVEPDHVPLDREGNRSWIIYVLGGNYPENHPILSTPSLFTESPTYEDMLLLSSLIGPAKPPVANEEDLASAGGLYTIITIGEKMAASAVEGEEFIPIEATQTCGICLTGYQKDEVTRTLKSCNHLFHRPCIDEWLTTGRNSCPLCRGLGVTERIAEASSENDSAAERPTAAAG